MTTHIAVAPPAIVRDRRFEIIPKALTLARSAPGPPLFAMQHRIHQSGPLGEVNKLREAKFVTTRHADTLTPTAAETRESARRQPRRAVSTEGTSRDLNEHRGNPVTRATEAPTAQTDLEDDAHPLRHAADTGGEAGLATRPAGGSD